MGPRTYNTWDSFDLNGWDDDVALAPSVPTMTWLDPPIFTPEQLAITDWPLLSTILLGRGITTRSDAELFLRQRRLEPGDPFDLPDMDRAVALIKETLASGGKIAIFGDYDVDGISSTAMLTRALRRLGADPLPVIPHRERDGYGLTQAAIDRLADKGVDLLIAVDCGSGNAEELERALAHGMQAIVLDHHRVHHDLPATIPFVSPRRDVSRYPEAELAAVGVSYTLLRALLGDDEAEMYLPYVALGTVADVVQLRGENRELVTKGLELLRRWKLPGLQALCSFANIERKTITAFEIGFIIGPRINAAGRMASPDIALDWFLADDQREAIRLAAELDRLNRARQADTQRVLDEAEQEIARQGGAAALPAIVVASEGWPIGVAGIVAGRLADRYHRPAIVMERGTSISRGSARSGGVVDVVEAIRRSSDLLVQFGGHTAAAGLTIETHLIDQFRETFTRHTLDLMGGRLPDPTLRLDAEVPHSDLSLRTVDRLAVIEPCGAGNESPLLLVRGLTPTDIRQSRNGKHLLFNVLDSRGRRHQATLFGAGERIDELTALDRIDAACTLEANRWNGRVNLQIRMRDFRPARG